MDLKGKLLLKNTQIEEAEMGADTGILDIETGTYYMLNEIGTDIWAFLDTPQKYEQIIDKLLTVYDIDYKTCEQETASFIEKMVTKKLIQVED
jgi:hypothetical protein